MKLQLVLIGLLCVVFFGFGYWFGSGVVPQPIERVERIYSDTNYNFIKPTKELLPHQSFWYLPIVIEKTKIDTVRIPIKWEEYVVSQPYPLTITPSQFTFTYYNPTLNRIITDSYNIPEKVFQYSATSSFLYNILDKNIYFHNDITVYYKRYGIKSIVGIGTNKNVYVMLGVSIKL